MNNKWGMIKKDGGLWTGPESMIKELEKRGWLFVTNPKRMYYPEFDETNPNYKPQEDVVKSPDTLYVEVC